MSTGNSAGSRRWSGRRAWLICIAVVVVAVGGGAVVAMMTDGSGSRAQASPQPHVSITISGLGPSWSPGAHPPLTTSEPIAGASVASIEHGLPGSWRVTLTADGTEGLTMAGTSDSAVPGAQVRVGVGLAGPNPDTQVTTLTCEITRAPVHLDAATLNAASACVDTVLPTGDRPAVAHWLTASAPTVLTGTSATYGLHGLQITASVKANTYTVTVIAVPVG